MNSLNLIGVLLLIMLKNLSAQNQNFKLTVLHDNDLHARFEQTSQKSGECGANKTLCYGGFARVAHEVRRLRSEATNGLIPPVIFLNAGDTYTGTIWFSTFKEVITAEFLNILNPDAVSLGNHEFDKGTENLGKFLDLIEFPVVAANVKVDNEPALQNKLLNSKIISVANTNIGIIGYLTPETKFLAISNNVQFTDEIEAINEEASKLKAQGVKIIIALGHSGLERDKEIARDCPDIDIVIGGHSHSFLYTGNPLPDIELPEDDYPIFITQQSGRTVLVVQSYAYSKYLGCFEIEFDSNGEYVSAQGSPILLNSAVQEDQDVLDILDTYRPKIEELKTEVLGQSLVYLEGGREICRRYECNLGNFITDSMVHWNALKYQGEGWTDAAIALMNSGGIRASIENADSADVTRADVMTVLPFEDIVIAIEVTGQTLVDALERSVERYDLNGRAQGEFLQMSGLQVVYDLRKPKNRVKELKVLCAYCEIPVYEPVDLNKNYRIMVTKFTANGGDEYLMFKGTIAKESEDPLTDAVILYLNKTSPVYPAVEGRITILQFPANQASSP